MKDEKNSIFRAKTVEAVQSPEVLDQYLKVTSPGVWIFLGAVVCLLAGVILWGVFGSIETTLEVAVVIEDSNTGYCIVPYQCFESVEAAGEITVDGSVYLLDNREYVTRVLDENTDPRIFVCSGGEPGDYVVLIPLLECPRNSGVYVGSVVTEILKPISLLLS